MRINLSFLSTLLLANCAHPAPPPHPPPHTHTHLLSLSLSLLAEGGGIKGMARGGAFHRGAAGMMHPNGMGMAGALGAWPPTRSGSGDGHSGGGGAAGAAMQGRPLVKMSLAATKKLRPVEMLVRVALPCRSVFLLLSYRPLPNINAYATTTTTHTH